MTSLPTWWHTTTTVNGRAGPSTSAAITSVQPANHNFWASKQLPGGGRTWLVSDRGTHYAKEFCKPGKAAKTSSRIPSPTPGVGPSTPWRKRPNNRSYWQTRGYHTGTDFAARTGHTIVAVRAGRVARYRDRILGNVALLYWTDSKGRKFTYWYCHLSAITKIGTVKAGQQIGRVGMTGTGAAMGPHLHLERRAGHSAYWGGTDLNPMTW